MTEASTTLGLPPRRSTRRLAGPLAHRDLPRAHHRHAPSWQVQRIGYQPSDALGHDYPAVLRGTIDSVSGCAAEAFAAIPTTQGAA
jgi:hypothetical protein